MEPSHFLEVRHIVKRFAAHTALDDVSLDVPRGKVFGLLGPNGAGKTTLLRIINRITLPDSGEVLFDGHPFCAADVQRIGYLPEERGLYKKMKVGEQALYLARLRGLSRSDAERRLKAWFDKFGIMPWWNRKLEELSKGMQQKVQFIITVVHEPSLLIFDEPFSGFDPVNAELLKQEILALRDKGHTIVYSTHNMASVEDVCDSIALIDRSRVVLSGEVDEIKERFRTGRYEVVATTPLPAEADSLYTIESHRVRSHIHTYEISKRQGVEASQLIATLAQQADLRAVSEKMPTMQEIFLRTVRHAPSQP